MISVKWDGGEEIGFSSREAAELFIEKICKRVAPELDYSICITQVDNAKADSYPDTTSEFLGYEEMVEQYLSRRGGQAFQSDIVKDSGLSKSKICIVLAKMKEDGRLLKIRKGKRNIIRLAGKTKKKEY